MSVLEMPQGCEPSSFRCCPQSFHPAQDPGWRLPSGSLRGRNCFSGLEAQGNAGRALLGTSFIYEHGRERFAAAVGDGRAEQRWPCCCSITNTSNSNLCLSSYGIFRCCLIPIRCLFLEWASAFLLIQQAKVSIFYFFIFNAPWLAPGATMCVRRDPSAREPGCGVGMGAGAALHPRSVRTHSQEEGFPAAFSLGLLRAYFL